MGSRVMETYYGEPVYTSSYHQQSRGPYTRSHSVYPGRSGVLPVLELKVPMCCEKCQEKVKEELEELEGVREVHCDQYNQRVTITGYVDPLKALKKVKKVKKKSEFFKGGSYIDGSNYVNIRDDRDIQYTGRRMIHNSSFGNGLTRSNSFGRGLGRLSSFGRVAPYEGTRYEDFEPRDARRDFYGVRRMPSFNRHRHHDAEYISMDNQYIPSYGETHYVSHHNQRPIYRPQVSFSNIPVTNPYYIQHIESEYY